MELGAGGCPGGALGSGSCSGTAPGLAGDQGTRWGHPQPSAQRLPCQGDNSTWDEPSTEPGRIGPPQCHPTSYRPQGSRRAHPPPPAPSARVPAPSPPPRRGTGGTEGSGKLKPAPCCWDEGTQGCRGGLGCSQLAPALPVVSLSPSPSVCWQRPGSPAAPRPLGACSHGRALAPCPVPVSSCFLLSYFFLFFFPQNTSPRNARGGGSTISHCEHLSLYCSAGQKHSAPG